MPDIRQKLDLGSRLVIVVTLALFVAALFVKGFGHGLLLEAGVFLVSVKLIIMAARHGATDRELRQRLDQIDATLAEVRDRLGSRLRSEPTEAPQPR
jgi:uncharacterized membrane protein